MLPLLYVLLATARSSLKAQRELALENLALRQQLAILQRKTKRSRLTNADRAFWVALSRLRRILRTYLEYYHGSRTHLALGKDTPERRKHESPNGGKVIALPMVGGLHHRYTQRAA